MGVDHTPGLVDALRDTIGDNLRVVAEYDRNGYSVVYIQDEVEDRIADYAEDVHHELVLQGIGREHLEQLFDAGDLHCSMHRFDEMTAFHFIEAEYTGVFVSIDSDCSIDLDEFANVVREYID